MSSLSPTPRGENNRINFSHQTSVENDLKKILEILAKIEQHQKQQAGLPSSPVTLRLIINPGCSNQNLGSRTFPIPTNSNTRNSAANKTGQPCCQESVAKLVALVQKINSTQPTFKGYKLFFSISRNQDSINQLCFLVRNIVYL